MEGFSGGLLTSFCDFGGTYSTYYGEKRESFFPWWSGGISVISKSQSILRGELVGNEPRGERRSFGLGYWALWRGGFIFAFPTKTVNLKRITRRIRVSKIHFSYLFGHRACNWEATLDKSESTSQSICKQPKRLYVVSMASGLVWIDAIISCDE